MAHGPDTEEMLRRFEEAKVTKVLDVSRLHLHSLPELPADLITLNCTRTQITYLPQLPAGLQVLECNYTPLSALPELPETLRRLQCNGTSIVELPTLPPDLEVISCLFTAITTLPELPPALKSLSTDYAPLKLNRDAYECIAVYNLAWRAWREEKAAKQRAKERCTALKEELVAAVWAPARVERWVEAGIELESL